MFTPDRNGTPEMMHEMMKTFQEVTSQIKFRPLVMRPLAMIWKPFRRPNRTAAITRPVAVRRTSISFEEC